MFVGELVTILKKYGVLNRNYTNVMFVGEVGDSSEKYQLGIQIFFSVNCNSTMASG